MTKYDLMKLNKIGRDYYLQSWGILRILTNNIGLNSGKVILERMLNPTCFSWVAYKDKHISVNIREM
jgi:hypothetical protein